MDEFNETLEGLEEKIEEYEKQLALVRDEIKKYEKPEEENEQIKNLKKLEADMIEVINLTRDLIKYKKQNELENDENKELERSGEVAPDIHEHIKESNKFIGRTCSLNYENKMVYGLIENVVIHNNIEQLLIHIFETNDRIMIPPNYVQLNEVLNESALKENNQFQALYKKDGSSSNKEEKKDQRNYPTAGYKFPENLIIKEGDSLKVKMAKKKKRIPLKKNQKDEIMDKEFSNKSNQWRSFPEKAISKSNHLLVSTKRVENIENKNNQSNFNIRRKFDSNDNEE
ncbi:hypothetical protein PFMG_03275 [Plasmodium falciparum IGH-CR14]|uniref:Uncharacterized protein n=1 Tax=Plasmodium falciparum IGH-CR14 TaxID=580059 RepID=A0A0L1IBN5_PLAFA|nr:hypothetical protein PFMG_03275 [Plasmodium falciparum IGH-CR14]